MNDHLISFFYVVYTKEQYFLEGVRLTDQIMCSFDLVMCSGTLFSKSIVNQKTQLYLLPMYVPKRLM